MNDKQDQINRLKKRIAKLEKSGSDGDLLRTCRENLVKLEPPQLSYPVTFIWHPAPWVAAIAGQWVCADDGRIETIFANRAELESVVWVMQTLKKVEHHDTERLIPTKITNGESLTHEL